MKDLEELWDNDENDTELFSNNPINTKNKEEELSKKDEERILIAQRRAQRFIKE